MAGHICVLVRSEQCARLAGSVLILPTLTFSVRAVNTCLFSMVLRAGDLLRAEVEKGSELVGQASLRKQYFVDLCVGVI